jgi:hypothetical protein
MASYGRNFDFRVPPNHGQRGGRYAIPSDGTPIPIGAPVKWTGDPTDVSGRMPVELATGASVPQKGQCGVLVYEAVNFAGLDALLTTASDIDKAPAGQAVQVVSGDMVKVAFRNTTTRVFLGARTYPGRLMVAGTPAVGDLLTPGTGNDTAGYWAVTTTAADAWLVVESVDTARGELDARFVF